MKLTADSYLAVLRKSGLIEAERLKPIVDELRAAGVQVNDSQALSGALVERGYLTQWQADKLLGGKSRGFFLGKYRLESLLGKGGMSSVYLAEHVLMRRRCAIKVLPQKRVNDSSYLGRFHREAQAVASLDHSNIVRAYDVDVDRTIEKDHEIHFLVMEYVEGRSLQELIFRDGVLDFVEAADYIRQAADGLAHAHQAGMVHRDVKPGNLLVDPAGAVKILDLGLARFFDDQDEVSLTVAHDEKVLGTADYLAPEQALDSHTVDARADVYSLGCTFYFLLTGHPPFSEGTLAQRLMSHQSKEPPAIENDRSDAPADLTAIIRKMMSKNADDRYQTAADVSAALAEWLAENAPEQWKAQHPSFSDSGKGSDVSPTAAPTESSTAGAATVVEGDDNLVSFLSNLETQVDPDLAGADGKTGRDKPRKPKRTDEPRAKPAAAKSDSGKPSPPKTAPPKPHRSGSVPVAAPVAKPAANPAATGAAVAVPVAKPVAVAPPVVAPPRPSTQTTPTKPAPRGFFSDPNRVKQLALIAGAVLLAAGLIWGVVKLVGNGDTTEDGDGKTGIAKKNGKGNAAAVIEVSPEGEIKTIMAGIAEARKRFDPDDDTTFQQTVRVAGGKTYSGQIVIEDNDFSTASLDLKIICDPEKPAVIAPPGRKPIVVLRNAQNVTLDGFHLKADDAPEAVEVAGLCVGLRLRNLKITGFQKTGVLVSSLSNIDADKRPVQFDALDLRDAAATAVGIRFQGEKTLLGLHITRCRFIGKMAAGIQFEGGHIEQSHISDCLFHDLRDGIRIVKSPLVKQFDFRDNTFHASANGVTFAGTPNEMLGKITIARNLFAKIRGAEVGVAGKVQPPRIRKVVKTSDNMTTRQSNRKKKKGLLPGMFRGKEQIGVTLNFLSNDPKSPDFLLPKANAAHRNVGARKRGR